MVKKKKKRLGFFINLLLSLVIIGVVLVGAYFALDKLVVPKYFKDYGIYNMADLVGMVKTLYNSPDESEFITHGFALSDQNSAVTKLTDLGFLTTSTGDIDYNAIANGEDMHPEGEKEFTDREIAAILDQMLGSGIMASHLPNIRYLDTIKINILELVIIPVEEVDEDGMKYYAEDKASVNFTFKLDTASVRNQMATAMDTPLFLLNMIVPKTLYITVNYELETNQEGDWVVNGGNIAVNNRTAKDSEILLNLLIEFIFPEEDEMTIEKFSSECGNIMIIGMDMLGDIKIKTNIGLAKANGVLLTIN